MKERIKSFFNENRWLFLVVVIAWGALFKNAFNLFAIPSSDNYFMLAHDALIKEHGFVTTEMLRMHEGFEFVVPQWLFATCFSGILNTFGQEIGYKIAGVILFSMFALCMFFFGRYFGGKRATVMYGVMYCIVLTLMFFAGVRPYYITVMLLMLEVMALEEYYKKGKDKFLIALPIMSVVLINVHNSLWFGLFLVLACYIADSLVVSIKYRHLDKRFLALIGVSVVSVLSGLINPYGLKYITYLFSSIKSVEPLKAIIGELKPIFVNPIIVIFILVMVVCVVKNYKRLTVRHAFLFFGFLLASILYYRNAILFLTVGQACWFSILGNKEMPLMSYKPVRVSLTVLVICFLGVFTVVSDFTPDLGNYNAVEAIEKYGGSNKDVTIFSDATDTCSYATMLGYKSYMDGCAEIYGIENNKKFDVAEEFIGVWNDKDEFYKLLDKYNFDYLVLSDSCIDIYDFDTRGTKYIKLGEFKSAGSFNDFTLYRLKE